MDEQAKKYIFDLLAPTVIGSVIAFIAKSIYDLLLERRKANLTYINNQIEKLYGPLYLLDNASAAAYNTFLKKINRENDPNLEQPFSEEEKQEWILWVESIFMPMNLEMESIIKANAHFLSQTNTPKPILDFISHVTVYKTVIKKWKNNDFSEWFSLIDYPLEFSDYIDKSYVELKTKQHKYIQKLKI